MRSKAAVGIAVGLFCVVGAGYFISQKVRAPQQPKSDFEKMMAASDGIRPKVDEMIRSAHAEARKRNFDKAFAICDEALRLYGSISVPDSTTYSDFAGFIWEEKKVIGCLQKRGDIKAPTSRAELKTALVGALQSLDGVKLAVLMSCRLGVGVPYSEYDFVDPEHAANQLIDARMGPDGKALPLVVTDADDLLTEGYRGESARKFKFEMEADSRVWQVQFVLEGKKADMIRVEEASD